jgi:hypothetical protein
MAVMDDARLADLELAMLLIREHDATPTPLPDDQHSAYFHQGDLIRHQMDDLRWPHFTVGTTELLRHSDQEITGVPAAELGTYTLSVGRCGGLAPYVGRPFHYEWLYAVDHFKRWVGGTAFMVYDEPDLTDGD